MQFISTPELGTNRFAGMDIGARGAKMSAGAGANPPGFAILLGFRTSTYRLLVPEKEERNTWRLLDLFLRTCNKVLCEIQRDVGEATARNSPLTCSHGEHVDWRAATGRCGGPSGAGHLRHLGEDGRRR